MPHETEPSPEDMGLTPKDLGETQTPGTPEIPDVPESPEAAEKLEAFINQDYEILLKEAGTSLQLKTLLARAAEYGGGGGVILAAVKSGNTIGENVLQGDFNEAALAAALGLAAITAGGTISTVGKKMWERVSEKWKALGRIEGTQEVQNS